MRAEHAVDIGNRLELFVDEHLLDEMTGGAGLRLHKPIPREKALVTDKPWEGNMCGYVTVFRDDETYRMYYKAWHVTMNEGKMQEHHLLIAYAESRDGIHWQKPDLGLFDFHGSSKNNIVWEGEGEDLKGIHGFAPFKDANPACPPGARYKAVGANRDCKGGLYAMTSPDGIHWAMLREEPIITKGAFDSQNLAFWDPARGEYRAYIRDFRDGWCRDIRTATSDDFVHWTDPVWLEYPGAPPELSFYVTEGYWRGESTTFRRYTLRLDGFVSVQAPMSGGEFVTRPLRFEGSRLALNFSTSAAGSVRIEIQDVSGQPIQGFSLSDCPETVGDEIERMVSWKQGGDVSQLVGQPIRLRFVMKDADIYALHFE